MQNRTEKKESDPERKTQKLSARVTEFELNAIKEKARKVHMSQSNFIVASCLDKEITVIEGFKEFSKELNRVGTNLNQIARLCNQGLISSPDIKETQECLKNIYQELLKVNKKSKKTGG